MIDTLNITNFKNCASLKVKFSPRINFFVGLNGVGKTNLLDAIHYLCVTKSFITAQDKYNVNFESDFFRIEGEVRRQDKPHQVCAKVRPGSVKEILLDNKKVERLGDHIGFLPVIVLSPKDQVLVSGVSADRRRFMDFYLCQTNASYLNDLMIYNRLLTQRNAMLKEHGWRADEQLIRTYSVKMSEPARRIATMRSHFLESIQPNVQQIYRAISDNETPVRLEYQSEFPEQEMQLIADETLEKDKAMGRTTRGIHRDDMLFDLSDHPLKRFGSQGQLKSYLIALHLALYEYVLGQTGIAPMLLLDDIFDKLDDDRVRKLVLTLGHRDFGQVFITDARSERVAEVCAQLSSGVRVFQIADGRIIATEDYSEFE